MRILCGYNSPRHLNPEALYALSRYSVSYRIDLIDVSYDRSAYWHAIRDRWNGREGLAIVEQDNVIRPETMNNFAACPEDWCCYSYQGPEWLGQLTLSLGCTRFSARLQRAIPADAIGGDYFAWFLLDVRFAKLFRMHGFQPHVHGEVKHLHDYEAESTPEERERSALIYNMFKDDFFEKMRD